MQYLILTPGQEPETVNAAEPLTYSQRAAIVGYPMEVLRVAGGAATIYMCEEGKQQGLPINTLATRLADGNIRPEDFIVGRVLVLGPPDSAGDDNGLTDETLAQLLEALR